MFDFSGMRNQNAQAKTGNTQKELAAKLGIGETRYSALMKGKAVPTLTELGKMCDGFGCGICDLVEFKEE